jgi:uncharacterized membrane protein YvbJ
MTFCNNCGTQNTDNNKFCLNCGNSLIREDSIKKLEHTLPVEPHFKKFDKKIKSWLIIIIVVLIIVSTFIIWHYSNSKDPASLNDEILKGNVIVSPNTTTTVNAEQRDTILNNTTSLIGYYIANCSDTRRIYFHNAPDEATKRKAYLSTQETVYVQKVENGFGYIEFTNTNGQTSYGWVEMKYLIIKPN